MNNEPNFNDRKPEETPDPAPQPQYVPDPAPVNGNASGYAPDPFADSNVRPGRGFAIAALVLGILSVVGLCCCCSVPAVSAAFGVVAIVLAIIYSQKTGKLDGMALAGLILGIIGIVIAISLIIIFWLNADAVRAALEEFLNDFKNQNPDFDFGMYSGN